MQTDKKLALWGLVCFVISLFVTHIFIKKGPYGFPLLLISVGFLAIAAKKAAKNSNPAVYAYVFAIFGVFIGFGLFLLVVEHQH